MPWRLFNFNMGISNFNRKFKKRICNLCEDPCKLYLKDRKPHFCAVKSHKIPANYAYSGKELCLYCVHYDDITALERK